MELRRWTAYYLKRKNAHGLHSPFVFDWYQACVLKKNADARLLRIEQTRKAFSRLKDRFVKQDFGMGESGRTMDVKQLLNHSLGKVYGNILWNTVAYMQYRVVLELGTCLGIGSCYLTGGNAHVHTLEGCAETMERAGKFVVQAGFSDIHIKKGEFSLTLPGVLSELNKIDMVFFDGNHRGDATLAYYQMIRPYLNACGTLVFDDIRWSEDMWQVWRKICDLEKNRYAVDLGRIGMIFLQTRNHPQYFFLKP
jgi:predicted O-methyltransferase YrrM